jgi:hypothetical protein
LRSQSTTVSDHTTKPIHPRLHEGSSDQNAVTHIARVQQFVSGLRTAETEDSTTVLTSLWIRHERVRVYFHCAPLLANRCLAVSPQSALEPKQGSIPRQHWSSEGSARNVASISVIHASACSYSPSQMFCGNTYIDLEGTVYLCVRW